ncbi:MAG: peroxiredoxin-like family protein, partial [Cyclobacteriaceae bacterium]
RDSIWPLKDNYKHMKVYLICFSVLASLNIYSMVLAQEELKSKAEVKGLAVGSTAENFSAKDHEGKDFDLYQALTNGPVVLFFYRGHWCPVCNRHLSELEENLDLIYQKGAQVIAISPEKPELMEKTIKKTKASFTLLYDEDYRISEAFDVAYLPAKPAVRKYNLFLGAKLSKAHSDESERLPIPATYIIEETGEISWRHFDADYKNRASAKDIAEALDHH